MFIEKLMNEGEQMVSEAAAICFLENLINAVSWGRIEGSSFINLLARNQKNIAKLGTSFLE